MLAYLLQDAQDIFDPIAGMNDPGVMRSFNMGLSRIREHLVDARRAALPSGCHETLCYHFHVGTALLTALLDGMAVYVEKKVAVPGAPGLVYWASETTFIDPRFVELRKIQQRTKEYIIKGGITAQTLRNFAKHYLPWLPLSDATPGGTWDIRFPINNTDRTGPILSGLLFPLFNDAREACVAFAQLLGQEPTLILPL